MRRKIVSYLTLICMITTTLLLQESSIAFAPAANGIFGLPAVLKGNVEILGVATHESFRKWQLDILINGDEKQASFVAVGETQLEDLSRLAVLNTAQYPNGQHKLRLRVAYTGLQYDEFFTSITIANGIVIPDETVREETMEETVLEPGLPEEQQAVEAPAIAYDPETYATTLRVGSGYQPSEPISRSATRTEIVAAQDIDVVNLQTDLPDGQRRIEVDLSEQKLTAYQGDVPIMVTQVSTGRQNGTDPLVYWTETVTGSYTIQRRYESARMVGPGYNTPDVPYIQYFFRGYAIHGAYWHNEFGMPVSHGCINMRVEEAKALFEWADVGTEIVIYE